MPNPARRTSYYPKSNPGGYQTGVVFQMDGNCQQTVYSVWINEMSLDYRWLR